MTSSINRNVPVAQTAASAAPIHTLANAAANDIEALQSSVATGTTQTATNTAAITAIQAALGVNVISSGAVGDGTTNDTLAIQAAFNTASTVNTVIVFPKGKVYAVTNITIPNVANIMIQGNGSTMKRIAGGDTSYMIATANWVGNAAFTGLPIAVHDMTFDGNGIAASSFINMCWNTTFDNCTFLGAAGGGALDAGLKNTAQTKNGSTIGTTQVNIRMHTCSFINNTGSGVALADSSATRLTDTMIKNCFIHDNTQYGIWADQLAGSVIIGNHLYSNTLDDLGVGFWGFGGVVSGNDFEGGIGVNDGQNPGTFGPGNQVAGTLTVTFGGTLNRFVSSSNTYSGTGAILHNDFDPTKTIISQGDAFSTNTPFAWNNSSSTGVIIAKGCYSTTNNANYNGQQRAIGGTYVYRQEEWGTAAPGAGTYQQGAIVWNLNPAAAGNIGWVCTTGGTPGTWKTFGTIAA